MVNVRVIASAKVIEGEGISNPERQTIPICELQTHYLLTNTMRIDMKIIQLDRTYAN